MEDNLFTILCWFLPSININQLSVYIRPLPLEPSSNLLHPTPLGGHRALGWAPCVAQCYSKFPLAICFKYGTVYVSVLLTQFNPPSPSHTVSTSLFFMSLFYSCVVFPPLLVPFAEFPFHLALNYCHNTLVLSFFSLHSTLSLWFRSCSTVRSLKLSVFYCPYLCQSLTYSLLLLSSLFYFHIKNKTWNSSRFFLLFCLDMAASLHRAKNYIHIGLFEDPVQRSSSKTLT